MPARFVDLVPEFSGDLVLSDFLSVLLDAYDADVGLPRRSRIDVRGLGAAKALPFVWIMERTADDRFRYRLTGEEVRANFGRSVKNAFIEDVVESANAREVAASYRTLLDHRAVCYSRGPTFGQLQSYIAERIMVPACDDAGNAVFVMSCFQRRDVSPLDAENANITFAVQVARFCPVADLVG
jgi:hypothetical protein